MRSTVPLFAAALLVSMPALASETLPLPTFRSVELNGGGTIRVVPGPVQRVSIVEGSSQVTRLHVEPDGKLRIDMCAERCPASYRLRIEIQSPEVPPLAVQGGGEIVTAASFGPQSHLAVAVNGGGEIDARSVDAGAVAAAVRGGGNLLVKPRSRLAASVEGGGHVRYWGKPTVAMMVRGGGTVSPAD